MAVIYFLGLITAFIAGFISGFIAGVIGDGIRRPDQ
jgi:hypothetical protein